MQVYKWEAYLLNNLQHIGRWCLCARLKSNARLVRRRQAHYCTLSSGSGRCLQARHDGALTGCATTSPWHVAGVLCCHGHASAQQLSLLESLLQLLLLQLVLDVRTEWNRTLGFLGKIITRVKPLQNNVNQAALIINFYLNLNKIK